MARYLITLDSGVHASDAAALSAVSAAGAAVVKTYAFSLTYEVEATAEQVAAISGLVDSLEKNTATTVSVQMANQDHLSFLASSSAPNTISYAPQSTGAAGHIYLVDTGIYADHEQFVGRNINNLYSNFNDDFADNTGHGTAVASVIIGNTQGVSRDSVLHVVKLFDSGAGSITVGEILDALDAVLVHHQANTPSQVKVVCLPWTTPQSNFLDNKITEMNASNLVVVAAAGNDGVDVNTVSPAGVEVVLTVGAVNQDFHVTSFTNVPWTNPATAYFNNYGAALDVFTLGVNVSCAGTLADDSYILSSGTSVASGIAAGVAIQWALNYPDKTSSQIKNVVLQEGHLMGSSVLAFDADSPAATTNVFRSILTTKLLGDDSLGNLPSGNVLDVQLGQTVTLDLELNLAEISDLGVLEFAPMPPWASLDFATGILTVNTVGVDAALAPGSYYFGLKGTINGKTKVEEYSISLYNTDISELSTAAQYYYDTETSSYDEVISYQVAPTNKN